MFKRFIFVAKKIRESHIHSLSTPLRHYPPTVNFEPTTEAFKLAGKEVGRRVLSKAIDWWSAKKQKELHEGPRSAEHHVWKPAIQHFAFSEKAHLYLVYLPGLASQDVAVKMENGVLKVSGQRAKKKLVEDMYSKYHGTITLPEGLPVDQVFFLRFKRCVLKIIIDDDYIIRNKDDLGTDDDKDDEDGEGGIKIDGFLGEPF